MNAPVKTEGADLRDYLAAERTFLAWVRTGLALMGFGFVVARFGLFLQQIQFIQHIPEPGPFGISIWFGTALIAAGVAVFVLSTWHYLRLIRELNEGRLLFRRPSSEAIWVAFFLALVGLAMAVYLISVRDSSNTHSENHEEKHMAAVSEKGIVNKLSNHTVEQSVDRLKSILQSKGVKLFALVDHSGEAAAAGLEMPPTKLLIFGSPKAGTPLMLAAPSIAIDLPLKILVWQDTQGKVWISYNSPQYLEERHGLPSDLLPNIAIIEALVAKAAE